MKTRSHKQANYGFSLSLVLVFTGVLFLLLTGLLAWTTTNGNMTQRYIEYHDTVAAAEAATEKVVASMASDFQSSGASGVDANLSSYGALVPTPGEVSDWGNYEFDDPSGAPNATYVSKLTAWLYNTDLNWKYSGFKGYASTYRIISNARNTASRYGITSAVKQEIQIASIPLFEFGVFYALDMETCALAYSFTVPGRVHCNGTIYSKPNQVTVTFQGDVTAAQKILSANSPNDPSPRTMGTNIFQGEHDWNVSSLNLPLGTNNNPTNLHALIDIPPGSESASSLLGLQRYYNKADLIILVSNATVVARSGAYNNFATTLYWTNINNFVDTNVSFNNNRESRTIKATQIDVARFATNNLLGGHAVKILYVADLRTQSSSTEAGVRLVNGSNLPAAGLTVATFNPLYVLGHYNAPDTTPGSTNSGAPASLVADAITLLSGGWTDPNSSSPGDMTLNAAVLAGIVPSNGSYFSGGLENFFRLQENWTSHTLTFNGSIVVLFPSQTANGWWGTGGYSPPVRMFSFDPKFKDNTKLPPGTPSVCTVIRSAWNITQAYSTQ